MTPVITALLGADGSVLGDVEVLTRRNRRAVDVVPRAGADVEHVADALVAAYPGHRVGVLDAPAVADRLVARGGVPARVRFVMDVDLTDVAVPAAVSGVVIAPMDAGRTLEYGIVSTRAYPPDHPDHEPSDATAAAAAATLDRLVRGEALGPWLAEASFHAVDGSAGDERVVGLIVASEIARSVAHAGGPWVTDVFVDPGDAGRGVGRALIGATMVALARSGRTSLGLAVTAGNPARRLYESLGFVIGQDVRNVDLPDQAGGSTSSSAYAVSERR